MYNSQEQFVVDECGNRTAVLMELERYQELFNAYEELETLRAFDEAKASGDEAIPFPLALRELEGDCLSGNAT